MGGSGNQGAWQRRDMVTKGAWQPRERGRKVPYTLLGVGGTPLGIIKLQLRGRKIAFAMVATHATTAIARKEGSNAERAAIQVCKGWRAGAVGVRMVRVRIRAAWGRRFSDFQIFTRFHQFEQHFKYLTIFVWKNTTKLSRGSRKCG